MVIYNVQSNGPCNQLVIELIDDTVYVEANLIAYISGEINLETKNNQDDKSMFIGKEYFKPKFEGTGKIYLHATLGSYHKFALKEKEELVLGPYAFVACRESIQIIPKLTISLRKFLSGMPMISLLAKGTGNVMVLMAGPVQEITLKDEKFMVFGSEVAAYSPQLRVTREIVGRNWAIGPKMARVFRGTGSVFFSPIPNKDARLRISK